MALSLDLSKIINTIVPFEDFVWILQKEEYDGARYLHWLLRFFFRRHFTIQEKLVPTPRALLVISVTGILMLIGILVLFVIASPFSRIIAVAVVFILLPLFVYLANLLLYPLFTILHARVRTQASRILSSHHNLKVIAVAGSFGKTTTKNFIYQLLRFHLRTQMTPGNINTPAGLAAWVVRHLSLGTQILIVEADSYHAYEMRMIANMIRPDIVVVTNVGDQHLERFKTPQRLADALKLLSIHAAPNGVTIADKNTLAQVASDRRMILVDTDTLTYQGEPIHASHLSESNKENLRLALAVAAQCAIPVHFVKKLVESLELPDRRQKHTFIHGYDGIDDSYNISLTTAKAGIAAAYRIAQDEQKKLLVIAAGIPEAGPHEKDTNQKLGEALQRADHVIVLGTMFADEIVRGVASDQKISRYATLAEFLVDARTHFPPHEWFLLQQPALPDLYY
ncbi:MAG: Mur ligase family protein [Patescibacteria group bacterium]